MGKIVGGRFVEDKKNLAQLGRKEAEAWIKNAKLEHVVDLAGREFVYGDELDFLYEAPSAYTENEDFAFAFHKTVRKYVLNVVRKARRASQDVSPENDAGS